MTVLLSDSDAEVVRTWLASEMKRQTPARRQELRRALLTNPSDSTTDDQVIDRAVALHGRELFCVKARRDAMLTAWAFRRGRGALRNLLGPKHSNRREDVVSRPWTMAFAKHALGVIGLPESLAHSAPGKRREAALAFKRESMELFDYQQENAERIALLCKEPKEPLNKPRMMLYLPTGAGKTRTACHGLVQRMRQGAVPGRLLLWISHTEELLEQAVSTFRDVWTEDPVAADAFSGEDPSEFGIWRCWGGQDRLEKVIREVEQDGAAGIAFATNLSLANWLLTDQRRLSVRNRDRLVENCWVIVIDEAHRAAATTYKTLLRNVGTVPILGLSATPFRFCEKETKSLRKMFGDRLSTVDSPDDRLSFDSVERDLEERGILARVVHDTWASEALVDSLSELDDLLPADAEKLRIDEARNRMIVDKVLARPKGSKTLVFAIDTEHAREIAMQLRHRGNRAFAVLGVTPPSLRRAAIEQYRSGELDTLVSVIVLTQGFDDPKTDLIVLARPTFSPVLFQQILGRGRRGQTLGGTDSMTFAYVKDRYPRGSVAAKRWKLVRQVLQARPTGGA